jgi:hypothetical protein
MERHYAHVSDLAKSDTSHVKRASAERNGHAGEESGFILQQRQVHSYLDRLASSTILSTNPSEASALGHDVYSISSTCPLSIPRSSCFSFQCISTHFHFWTTTPPRLKSLMSPSTTLLSSSSFEGKVVISAHCLSPLAAEVRPTKL